MAHYISLRNVFPIWFFKWMVIGDRVPPKWDMFSKLLLSDSVVFVSFSPFFLPARQPQYNAPLSVCVCVCARALHHSLRRHYHYNYTLACTTINQLYWNNIICILSLSLLLYDVCTMRASSVARISIAHLLLICAAHRWCTRIVDALHLRFPCFRIGWSLRTLKFNLH